MEGFNCDKMIDRAFYSDKMHSTELSVKDDKVVCPKDCLLLSYTVKSTFSSQTEYTNF